MFEDNFFVVVVVEEEEEEIINEENIRGKKQTPANITLFFDKFSLNAAEEFFNHRCCKLDPG